MPKLARFVIFLLIASFEIAWMILRVFHTTTSVNNRKRIACNKNSSVTQWYIFGHRCQRWEAAPNGHNCTIMNASRQWYSRDGAA